MPKCFSCDNCGSIFTVGVHEFDLLAGDIITTIEVLSSASRVQKGMGQISKGTICRSCIKKAIATEEGGEEERQSNVTSVESQD